MTKVLERVLLTGRRFETYEGLYRAFTTELGHAITTLGETAYAGDAAHEELLPQPLVSAFVDGPLDGGKEVKAKGGRNNLTGMNFVGFANVVDSLAAIRRLVYETGDLSLDEIVRAIGANFDGHEKIRQLLLNRAPKFGNDDDRVDRIAHDLWDFIASEVPHHRTFRGGHFVPGLISATLYMLAGAVSGATPDGRRAKAPVAVGGAPTNGACRQGPTAAMHSITAIEQRKAAAGVAVNLRFHPSVFRTPDHRGRFKDLIKTYFFELGGQHLQPTIVDSEALRKAKAEPEKYSDLMVRVAGYSARFVDLSPATQDEIHDPDGAISVADSVWGTCLIHTSMFIAHL
jgi:formate C-acetyltransferase